MALASCRGKGQDADITGNSDRKRRWLSETCAPAYDRSAAMKSSLITASMSLVVFAAGVALAPGLGAQPGGRVPLTVQQLDTIRAHALHEQRPSLAMPVDLVPAIGAEVPKSIQVFWMPPSVGLNRYRYAVVNQRILVLDNDDRRVVEVLEQR